ncbi:MAG: hypothetical protein HUU15_07070 [Candidatus Brocadiae bacterium]|nr:hypothetical protein [Candidatus Brocadiia bacterium]
MIAASKTTVNIFCNNETEHAKDKKYGNEEWCEHNYGQKCDEHVANHNALSSKFFSGSIPNPTTILCTPDGTEIARKKGAPSNKELIDMIKAAATKVGPGLGRDEYLFAKDKMKAAEEQIAAGKTPDAIKTLQTVTKTFAKNPAAKPALDAAQKKLDDLNQAGMDRIAAAKEAAAAGNVEEARKELKDVYNSCKGLECSKAAEKEMAALPKAK